MIHILQKTYYMYMLGRLIEESKGDMKSTWKILKHAVNRGYKSSTVIDTVFLEGQEFTNKKQIPEVFTILLTLGISLRVQLSKLIPLPLTILLKQIKGSVSSTFNQPKFSGYCQNLIKGSMEPTHRSVCSSVRKLPSMNVLKWLSTKVE